MRNAGLDTKDMGFPDYVIGMHIEKDKHDNILLNQQLYIETIVRRFNMTDAKPVSTPANSTVKLSKSMTPPTKSKSREMRQRPYQALVGALLYAVLTRPDIAVAVNECYKYMHEPGKAMWTVAKRILRYLKHTKHYKLTLKAKELKNGQRTMAFVDSSYADCPDTRRSRYGFIILYNGSPIAWKTRMQKCTAQSTAEAEYYAASMATQEIIWVRRLLKELDLPEEVPTPLLEDNNAQQTHRNEDSFYP